jgi:hypothetical protein
VDRQTFNNQIDRNHLDQSGDCHLAKVYQPFSLEQGNAHREGTPRIGSEEEREQEFVVFENCTDGTPKHPLDRARFFSIGPPKDFLRITKNSRDEDPPFVRRSTAAEEKTLNFTILI